MLRSFDDLPGKTHAFFSYLKLVLISHVIIEHSIQDMIVMIFPKINNIYFIMFGYD